MFKKSGKRLTLKFHFSTGTLLFLIALLAIQMVQIGEASSILNLDELKSFDRFYQPLRDYINYFANILDAKKQPTVDKSIFFHITSGYSTGIVSLDSRYGLFVFI